MMFAVCLSFFGYVNFLALMFGIHFLRSYALGFGLEWAFGCSFAFVILTFVDSGQYPAFILVDASARQCY